MSRNQDVPVFGLFDDFFQFIHEFLMGGDLAGPIFWQWFVMGVIKPLGVNSDQGQAGG